MFDKENAKDETRPADAAFAVPQVNKEHAPAARDPSDITQQASNHAPPSPSNRLHSDTTLRTDEAINSPFLAAVKPQDPGNLGAAPAAVEMYNTGIDKAGVTPSQGTIR